MAYAGGRERPARPARADAPAPRPTKSRKSGCGRVGRDRSSGWNCPATKNGWSGSSMISVSRPLWRVAGEHQARAARALVVRGVDLPAMAMPLVRRPARRRPRRPSCPGTRWQGCAPRRIVPPRSVTSFCSGSRSITGVRRRRVELARVRALEAAHVARELDHRALQAEADAEERHAPLARVPHGRDLALDAPDPEPARDQDAVDVAQRLLGRAAAEVVGGHPPDLHVGAVVEARRATGPPSRERYASRRFTYLPTTAIVTGSVAASIGRPAPPTR